MECFNDRTVLYAFTESKNELARPRNDLYLHVAIDPTDYVITSTGSPVLGLSGARESCPGTDLVLGPSLTCDNCPGSVLDI